MKKHPRQGKQVRGLSHLMDLIDQRKAVFVPYSNAYNVPRPAAFMVNLSGRTLHWLMKAGMYVYKKP